MHDSPKGIPRGIPEVPAEMVLYPYLAIRLRSENAHRVFVSFVKFCNTSSLKDTLTVKYISGVLNEILEERSLGVTMVRRLHGLIPPRDFVLHCLTYYSHTPRLSFHRVLIGSRKAGVGREVDGHTFFFQW